MIAMRITCAVILISALSEHCMLQVPDTDSVPICMHVLLILRFLSALLPSRSHGFFHCV